MRRWCYVVWLGLRNASRRFTITLVDSMLEHTRTCSTDTDCRPWPVTLVNADMHNSLNEVHISTKLQAALAFMESVRTMLATRNTLTCLPPIPPRRWSHNLFGCTHLISCFSKIIRWQCKPWKRLNPSPPTIEKVQVLEFPTGVDWSCSVELCICMHTDIVVQKWFHWFQITYLVRFRE